MLKSDKEIVTTQDAEVLARQLSPQDFLKLGMDHVVYIKPVEVKGGIRAYAIQAADGTTLSVEDSFDLAVGAVKDADFATVLLQ